MPNILSVQEAQARIVSALKTLDHETVSLAECPGRVLAQELRAPSDLPAFPNSSMDGFAVRASDTSGARPDAPVRLAIAFQVPAGSVVSTQLEAGQAARIMTGAMLPGGADAVIPVEDTSFSPDLLPESSEHEPAGFVDIFHPAKTGAYVRPKGQDVQAGQLLLPVGRRLQPQDIAILAATGTARVQVYRRPTVALFSSGDEIIQPGQALRAGQIYDSNQYMLAALLEEHGAQVLRLGVAPDRPEEIRALLERAVGSAADLIVTSAGVSVGAFDYIRQVIQSNGGLSFWKVNMRPGKPLVFGHYGGIPMIALPGNPVSAYVGCRIFVVPAIEKLSGWLKPSAARLTAALGEPLESDGRESYLRAVVRVESGRAVARLAGHQGSGNLFSLVQANALLIVPSGVKSLPSDSEVEFWYLDA